MLKKESNFFSFLQIGPICHGYTIHENKITSCVAYISRKNGVLDQIGTTSIDTFTPHKTTLSTATYITLALPASATCIKQIALPPLSEKNRFCAILDQLEQTHPLDIQDLSIGYDVFSQEPDELTVTVFISRKHDVRDAIEHANRLGMEPHSIIPRTVALRSFLAYFKLASWQYCIDIDDDEISFSVFYEGKVVETQNIFGVIPALSTIKNADDQPSNEVEQLLHTIYDTHQLFSERYTFAEPPLLTITGIYSTNLFLVSLLSEYLSLPLSPIHQHDIDGQLTSCAAAIGAAFSGNQNTTTHDSYNVRKDELSHPKPLFHWKKPLLCFITASLSICSFILFHSYTTTKAIYDEMQSQWTELLSLTNTNEETFLQKHPKISLTADIGIAEATHLLLQEIEKQSLFPLEPKIPKMTQVIAWLSTQIHAAQETIQDTTPLEIQHLHYSLIKYPSKATPKDHYLVKVTIDFATPSIALARAFHEQLLQKNLIIQEKSEITWVPSTAKYTLSFFLKDSTIYPQNIL